MSYFSIDHTSKKLRVQARFWRESVVHIQQLINLSTPCGITYTKTDLESLKLEQRALKIQIKTKIWTKEAQSFQILVRTFKFNSHAIV